MGLVQVAVTIATHPAQPCQARHLAGRYLDGGLGTGNHFGNAILLNTSRRPCTLPRALRLRGLGRDGRPVTTSFSEPIPPGMVLSARSSPERVNLEAPAALIAAFGFYGNERDDPHSRNGLCAPKTTPSAWLVILSSGARVRFRNGGPRSGGAYYSCHGDIRPDTNLNVIGSSGVHLLSSG